MIESALELISPIPLDNFISRFVYRTKARSTKYLLGYSYLMRKYFGTDGQADLWVCTPCSAALNSCNLLLRMLTSNGKECALLT